MPLQPHGLNTRHALQVGVLVVLLLLAVAELLLLPPSHPAHLPLLALAVSDLHLGGGLAVTPSPLLTSVVMSVVRCQLPVLATPHYLLTLVVEVPLARILGHGGHCEDLGPVLLLVKYR